MTESLTQPQTNPRWHVLALIFWAMIAFAYLAVYVIDLVLSYSLIVVPCDTESGCHYQSITTTEAEVLAGFNLPMEAYALYMLGITVLIVTIFVTLAIMMLRRLYPQGYGFLFSLMLIIIPTTAITSFDVVAGEYPAWTVPITLLFALGQALLISFFLIFPNGRFTPRWTVIFPFLIAASAVSDFFNEGFIDSPAFVLGYLALFITIVTIIVYRYRKVFSRSERQQAKWVLLGIVVFILGIPIWGYTFEFSDPASGQARLVTLLIGWTLANLTTLAIPVSIFIAIFRYRLWDIDLIIRKTLVYGSLTALLVAIYFASVLLLQNLLTTITGQQPTIAIVISTLAIAALFNPLRHRIQNFIDRRFYRQKYDAEKALAAFSLTVREEVDLESLTRELLAVVDETMQPENVSVWLREGSE